MRFFFFSPPKLSGDSGLTSSCLRGSIKQERRIYMLIHEDKLKYCKRVNVETQVYVLTPLQFQHDCLEHESPLPVDTLWRNMCVCVSLVYMTASVLVYIVLEVCKSMLCHVHVQCCENSKLHADITHACLFNRDLPRWCSSRVSVALQPSLPFIRPAALPFIIQYPAIWVTARVSNLLIKGKMCDKTSTTYIRATEMSRPTDLVRPDLRITNVTSSWFK